MPASRNTTTNIAYPARIFLRDGTPVLVRQVESDDKPLFEVGLEGLSAEDRYSRFFHPVSKLTDEMLRKLTEIDHVNEEAIGALDLSQEPNLPAGVARYVRDKEHETTAEVAVTIATSHQNRGLGTDLLGHLAVRALENGITSFNASVLNGNDRMLDLFEELKPDNKSQIGGAVEIRIPLHENPSEYPNTNVGNRFREIAQTRKRKPLHLH